jgi:uncharacterized repeat protein (TIGR01451 family)
MFQRWFARLLLLNHWQIAIVVIYAMSLSLVFVDHRASAAATGTLTVIVQVTNDNGGTKNPGDFTITVTADTSSPAPFVGADAPGTDLFLDPGNFSVSESTDGAYSSVQTGDCSGTIAIDQTLTCTITYDDIAPTLTVIKHVINDDGGTAAASDFMLHLKVKNGADVVGSPDQGSETGVLYTLSSGPYVVSEDTPTNGYAQVAITGDCDSSGEITLQPGENKTCAITNDDIPPHLTVIKVVQNNNGGILQPADFTLLVDDAPVTSGELLTMTIGSHTIGEIAHARYTGAFGKKCSNGQVNLKLGDNITCTITNTAKAAGIKITAQASAAAVLPGTTVNYTYTVQSTTAVSLTNPLLGDNHCTPIQPIQAGNFNVGDTNQNDALDLGESWHYSCATSINIDTVSTANVTAGSYAGLPVNASSGHIAVDVFGTMQLTNTPYSANILPPGGPVTFTVYIKNTSFGDQIILDSLQENQVGDIADNSNQTLLATTCSVPQTLAPGASYSCTYTVLVNGALDSQHVHTVSAGATDNTMTAVNASGSATVQISGALIQATKIDKLINDPDGNHLPSAGDTLAYTITVQNKGSTQAKNVVFADTLDSNTTLVNGSVKTSLGTVTAGNGNGNSNVAVQIGNLNVNASTIIGFKVKLNVAISDSVTQLVNQGLVSGQNFLVSPTDDPATTSIPNDATVTPLTVAPALTALKSVSLTVDADQNGQPSPGDTLTYQIVIANSSKATASGVIFNDTPDTNTSLLVNTLQQSSGSVVHGNQPGDTALEVDIGDIAGGASVAITYQVQIKQPLPAGVSKIRNQGFVNGANFPALATDDPDTLTVNDATLTQVVAAPVLYASKVATLAIDADQDGQPSPGDTLHYQINIANTGNTAATGVTLVDKLDANLTLAIGSVDSAQGTITHGNSTGDSEVDVELGVINGEGVVTIDFDVQINKPLSPTVVSVSNQGIVSSQELPPLFTDDPNTLAQEDATTTAVGAFPLLTATKRATLLIDNDNDKVAEPGDTLLYEVTIANNGNANATDVAFIDTIDANTTLVAGSVQTSHGTVQSGNNGHNTPIQVVIGTIAGSGGQVMISFKVTVNSTLPPEIVALVNQGLVKSHEQSDLFTDDPTTSAEADPTRTQIVAKPQLEVTKQDLLWIDGDDDRQVTLDDLLLYQIKVVNSGNMAATGVVLKDSIDSNTKLENGSIQTSQGTVQQGNSSGDQELTIAIGSIPANGTVNIGFRVRIKVNRNGQLSNQAAVSYAAPVLSGPQQDPIVMLSDDPDTPVANDATLTPLVRRTGLVSPTLYLPVINR